MRLKLASDYGGDIRMSLLPDLKKTSEVQVPRRRSLVHRAEVQDCIYGAQNADPVGFGSLSLSRKFTKLAKRRLKEYGSAIDQGSLENCIFLTGTLPGSTVAAKKALASWSSWLTSRLAQWFRDRYPEATFFGVWEYQKRGALHLHVCVRVLDKRDARDLKSVWKTRWIRLLDGVSRRTGIDLFEREQGDSWQRARWVVKTDAQTVERSVARYLAKYCSKTADKRRRAAAFPPGSWWFASASLREFCKQQRIEVTVSSLSLNDGHKLFASVGAELVAIASVSYPVFNAWDQRQAGLICLMPSAVAGVAVRAIRELLAILTPEISRKGNKRLATVAQAAAIFDSICLAVG